MIKKSGHTHCLMKLQQWWFLCVCRTVMTGGLLLSIKNTKGWSMFSLLTTLTDKLIALYDSTITAGDFPNDFVLEVLYVH